jgi:hypothetical protein
MSSLSSGLNSSSAVVVRDFIGRAGGRAMTSMDEVRLARSVSVGAAVLAVGLSLVVGSLATNLLELCFKVVNLLTAPIFVLFFLALFVPRATPFAAGGECDGRGGGRVRVGGEVVPLVAARSARRRGGGRGDGERTHPATKRGGLKLPLPGGEHPHPAVTTPHPAAKRRRPLPNGERWVLAFSCRFTHVQCFHLSPLGRGRPLKAGG